jgi:hypothetical protein
MSATEEKPTVDQNARAYGLAHSALLIEIFKRLLENEPMIPKDAKEIFDKVEQALLGGGTDISSAAVEHVRHIRRALPIK